MPIVPSLQIDFVREVLADLWFTSVDPSSVENEGGFTLRIEGRFKPDFPCTVEVMVGATPYVCYSASYGKGNEPVPLGENLLFCSTPELPIGGPYDLRVTQDGNTVTGVGVLSVSPRNWRSRIVALRRHLPPKWKKGPTDLSVLDSLVAYPVLHPIVSPVFFSQGFAGSYTPQVFQPVPFTWTSVGTALPGWASLNGTTGEITGTPGVLDVGTTTGHQLRADAGGGITYDTNTFDIEVG